MTHIIPDPASESDLTSLQIEDFWDRHGKTVVAGIVLLIVAAIVAVIILVVQHNRETAAEAAFADAANESQLREVMTKYSGSVPALDAGLLLAALQRKAGKYDEATATLESLAAKYSEGPLPGLPSLGIAANQAAANHMQQCAETLQQTAARYNSSFVAPWAMLSEAEIVMTQGKNSEAATILRNLITQYPDSISSRMAGGELERLESLVDTDTKN